jgi:hypothetical protein
MVPIVLGNVPRGGVRTRTTNGEVVEGLFFGISEPCDIGLLVNDRRRVILRDDQ